MKKSVKTILCLVLVIGIVCTLAACGGVAGRYELASMAMGDQEMDIAALKALAGTDVEMYIELKDDGTAVLAMDGEVTEMQWADGEMWPANNPSDKIPFTVDGDELTMEQSGIKLIFKK